ncbi:MAG: Uma2 family endonuclease [Armatimonadaceae bacterium]
MGIGVAVHRNELEPLRYRWTVDAFYRAVDAGVFEEPRRIEVIRGELWEKEPVNPPHALATERIARRFRQLFEPVCWVREEKPVRIAPDSEPIPDVTVVRGEAENYSEGHPTPADVLLLVEVANSTAAFDTGGKAQLYAEAGIREYWVWLIPRRELWVYRESSNGYGAPIVLGENDTIAPLFAPGDQVTVREFVSGAGRQP